MISPEPASAVQSVHLSGANPAAAYCGTKTASNPGSNEYSSAIFGKSNPCRRHFCLEVVPYGKLSDGHRSRSGPDRVAECERQPA